MSFTLTRRALIGSSLIGSGLALALPAVARATAPALKAAEARLSAIEARIGGRMGVAVLDSGSGARLNKRAGERFPMCSTFKFLAAAAALRQVDAGQMRLDQRVTYGESDLIAYAPVTKPHVGEGSLSLGDLCAAAVEVSDNPAANLILRELGGPEAVTRFIRTLGDDTTRLDRNEPSVNTAIPGDPRDTTTPQAMLVSMRAILLGPALSEKSHAQMENWLANCQTGANKLRAGLPASWRVGDKTGAGANATSNTIAILRPPGRAPLLAAVYCTGSRTASSKDLDAAQADVARLVAEIF
jgi:beta-lactamase class A